VQVVARADYCILHRNYLREALTVRDILEWGAAKRLDPVANPGDSLTQAEVVLERHLLDAVVAGAELLLRPRPGPAIALVVVRRARSLGSVRSATSFASQDTAENPGKQAITSPILGRPIAASKSGRTPAFELASDIMIAVFRRCRTYSHKPSLL